MAIQKETFLREEVRDGIIISAERKAAWGVLLDMLEILTGI